MIKTYEKNKKVILLNTQSGVWVRMGKEFYDRNKEKVEFSTLLNEKYSFYEEPPEIIAESDTVYFSVTRKCNLNCSFCSMSSNNKVDTSNEMIISTIKEKLQPLLSKRIRKVVITGGEPFERNDIFEILKCIVENVSSQKIILQTNGLLLNNQMIKDLKSYITALEISIENIVVNETLKNRMEELFLIIRKVGIGLSLSYVVTKENASYLRTGMQIALDFDAYFTYRFIEPAGEGTEIVKNMDVDEDYLWELEIQMEAIKFVLQKSAYDSKLAFGLKGQLLPQKSCGAYDSIIAIQANGEMFPCINTQDEDLSMGNLVADSLEKIQSNLKERKNKKNIKNKFHVDFKNRCNGCFYKYFCTGLCGAIKIDDSELQERYHDFICRSRKLYLDFHMFHVNSESSNKEYFKLLLYYLEMEWRRNKANEK